MKRQLRSRCALRSLSSCSVPGRSLSESGVVFIARSSADHSKRDPRLIEAADALMKTGVIIARPCRDVNRVASSGMIR